MTKRGRRLGFREFLLSLFLMIVVWSTKEFFSNGPPAGDNVEEPSASDVIQVLFTTPHSPDDVTPYGGGLDEQLAADIDGAEHSVDIAAYNFGLETVAEALIRAEQRGVRVRLLTDSDYEDEPGTSLLKAAGVPVVVDGQEPFMHNKFVVIDGDVVWTGSWNITDNGTYRNNNNVVIIRSTELGKNYALEFKEMFEQGKFGRTSPDTIPYPDIGLSGMRIETFFEPEGNARDRIIDLINKADTSVRFMAFVFTDDDIAKAIIAQHRAGLQVSGVVESRNIGATGSEVEQFLGAGVDVLADGNPYQLHHKVIILDESIVVTGSYNFSSSAANYNDENLLIIHSPDIAARYGQEFEEVYQQAVDAAGEGN